MANQLFSREQPFVSFYDAKNDQYMAPSFLFFSGQVVELNRRNQVGAGSCFTPPKEEEKNYTPENERMSPKKGLFQ